MSEDRGMEKNYLLALFLSLIVFAGYLFFVQKYYPKQTVPPPVVEKSSAFPDAPSLESKAALTPAENEPAPAILRYANNLYEIEFSTLGASVTRLLYRGEAGQHVTETLFYEGEPSSAGIFGLRLLHEETDLTKAVFKLTRHGQQNEIFEFVYERPEAYRLTKRYVLDPAKPDIGLDVVFENLSPREKHFPAEFTFGINYHFVDQASAHNFQVVTLAEKVESQNLQTILKKGFFLSKETAWTGILKHYFALLVKPDWKTLSVESEADDKSFWATLRMEPLSLAAGGKITRHFLIYAGPQRYEILKSFDVEFENILSRGFFGLFKIWLLLALKFCDRFVHNFGWAIILLTLGIKLLFTPLTHMSFESMKKMQALAPKLKSLQERYKSDPAKLNREMMELYRRNRVNPMMGCLPMLLQIPIFISFYQVLSETIELKGAPFLFWIHDLSEPDRLFRFPQALPFLGWDAFNLLPLFMIASMVWQQKLTPQAGTTPEQTKIMNFMPLIFGFMFYNMPSGLVLYWFVNNMLSIIHQVFVKRMVIVLHHEDRE